MTLAGRAKVGGNQMFQSIRQRMGHKATGTADVRLERMSPEELFETSHDAAKVAAPPAMITAEKAYIGRYRSNTSRPTEAPLHGLALSGGGIRSASIALGVMQALAAAQKLQKFDYLSTVSGGGYVGSSLTWFTSRPWTIQGKKDVQFGTGCGTGPVPVFPLELEGRSGRPHIRSASRSACFDTSVTTPTILSRPRDWASSSHRGSTFWRRSRSSCAAFLSTCSSG